MITRGKRNVLEKIAKNISYNYDIGNHNLFTFAVKHKISVKLDPCVSWQKLD